MVKKTIFDEVIYRYGQARSRLPFLLRRPLGFFFYLTGRCNLKCHFCWQRQEEERAASFIDTTKNEMTPGEWAKVVSNIPRGAFLGLSGGESTLSKALPVILQKAKGRNPVTVNSNGVNWSGEHFELFTGGAVKNLSVSLDGFAPVHDAGRGAMGLFDKVVANINELNRLRSNGRPSLTIKTVAMNENLEQLVDLWRFCRDELKADTFNVSFLKEGDLAQFSLLCHDDIKSMLRGAPAMLYDYHDPAKVLAVMDELLEQGRSSSCRVELYPRMGNTSQISVLLDKKGQGVYAPCYLPWSMVVVLPDGSVIPCLSYWLGNVREHGYDVMRVLRENRYKQFCSFLRSRGSDLPHSCCACCFAKVKSN